MSEHSATTKVVRLLGKPAHWRAWRPRGHFAPLEDDDRGVVVPIEGHAATALNPAVRAIPESMSKIQTPHEAVRHTLPKTVYFIMVRRPRF